MGNENSKNIELLNTIGTIPELLENAKGIAANISSHEITDAAVVSQILETYSLLKEEVKENNVDQTDVCLPASDPQTGTVKVIKKETGTADATKDQSQKENQPAATTTVAQVSKPPAAPIGMSIPPPPPPEPPKMEIKAEPAAKPSPKEEPKAAAKESESPKGKSAKLSLSKFFGSKVLVGVKASKGKASASGANAPAKSAAVTNKDAPPQPAVEVEETPVEVPEPCVVEVKSEDNVEPQDTAEQVAQPVVEEQMVEEVPPVVKAEKKVDFSKDDTLEAAAKPEPPPPVKELKKTLSRFSLFKPKTNKDAPPQPAVEVEVQPVVEVQETPVEVPEPCVVEVKSEDNVEPQDTAEQVAQPVVEEQMVEEVPPVVKAKKKVDFSKDDTLDAAAKPEPPPPVKEQKKTLFRFSLFSPKADDPKKATPAPAAAAETAKAKEEPKAAAKSSEAAVDNKPASVATQAEGDAANAPKKVEKKSFFKNLGQKRNSTDAGVQTEPASVAPAAGKAK
ncbi:breast carcinoma-amplified sequence 1 isoform 1-T1 [Lycodopsis pacificus]